MTDTKKCPRGRGAADLSLLIELLRRKNGFVLDDHLRWLRAKRSEAFQ